MLFILPYLQQFKLHCFGHSVINRRSKVGQHRAVDNRSHNPDYHVYYPGHLGPILDAVPKYDADRYHGNRRQPRINITFKLIVFHVFPSSVIKRYDSQPSLCIGNR